LSLFHIDAGKEWGRIQRQAFFLAKELKRQGYPFFFVVQPKSPLYFKAREADLPVFPLRIRSEFDLLAIFRLALAMRRNRCLLAHFHDAHSFTVGSVAASLTKVPIRIISRRVDFPLRQNPVSKRKYRKNVDSIIAISEGVKEVLMKGGIPEEVIEVIPSGIDFTPYDEASSSDYLRREFSFAPDDYLVGIVTHLAEHKGHTYLIQATKILKEHTDKIKVIILGGGPLKFELDEQARELKIEDIVYFLGFREDIPQILSSLDLFVLSSYLEGMGSSFLEAMACRLPVVATRTVGIPEVVVHKKTGLLVSSRSPSYLAKAILKLYKDRNLGSRLGQRGYEVARQKFSAEAMAVKIIDLYEKIAERKGFQLKKRE